MKKNTILKFISDPEQVVSILTTPQGLQKQNAKDPNPAVHIRPRAYTTSTNKVHKIKQM